MRFFSFSTRFYITLALSSIVTCMLVVGLAFKVLPDRQAVQARNMSVLADNLSTSLSLLVSASRFNEIKPLARSVMEVENAPTRSVLIRSGEAQTLFETPAFNTENTELLTRPVYLGGTMWGTIEMQYQPHAISVAGLFNVSYAYFQVAAISGACFLVFYFFLGRVLKQLDPSQAIPDRVQNALDTLIECLLILDEKGNIRLVNQSMEEVSGVSNLVGKHATAIQWLDEEGIAVDHGELPWVATGRSETNDRICIANTKGTLHSYMVNCSSIVGDNGNVQGTLVSLNDVTELERMQGELKEQTVKAEIANQAKSDFLSNMSHEIRTPLTAVLGFADIMKSSAFSNDARYQQYLDTISRSGNHLLTLINDILDLSKVEAGKLEVESMPVNPCLILIDVEDLLRDRADAKSIDIVASLEGPVPCEVLSDSVRFKQIITNLVGNAIKFTETGGVRIVASFDDAAHTLSVAVHDTGIGMTPDQLSNVFQEFAQADTSTTRKFGGTGLGLSISKKLANAMGGDIVVTSEYGSGSVFTVAITAEPVSTDLFNDLDAVREAQLKASAAASAVPMFDGLPVLVADDAEENRILLTVLLEERGLNVQTVENGQLAFEALESGHYEVVLSDLQMPVLDGYGFVAKAREAGHTVPIVALTADAMKGMREKVVAAGFSDYLTKPVELPALNATLSHYMPVSEHAEAKQPVESESAAEMSSPTESVQSPDAAVDVDFCGLSTKNERIRTIVEKYVAEHEGNVASLSEHLSASDLDNARMLAHRIKGTSGSMGFMKISETASEIEQFLLAGDLSAAVDVLPTLQRIRPQIATATQAQDKAA